MADVFVGGFRTQLTGEQTVASYVWDTNTLAWVPAVGGATGPTSNVTVSNPSLAVTQAGVWTISSGPLATGLKGLTAAGNPTSEATDANTQSLHTKIVNTTIPVTGAFFQATQPVSIASMPSTPVTGSFWPATQPVSIASTLPVTGAFFQTTQPVSIATMPTTPVTGSFWQATQPVSILAMPTTPVTGSFFQTTQPVSIATMPTTPVTGTFFQTTQPVAGTRLNNGTANAATGNHLTVGGTDGTNLRPLLVDTSGRPFINVNGSVATTGAFFQATQPVSIATMPTTPVTGTFFQTTQPVAGTRLNNGTAISSSGNHLTIGGTDGTNLRPLLVDTSGRPFINVNGSVATTGAFFQATQPVSIAAMPTTPVTGSFYQTTQPVSIAAMPTTPVTGSFYQTTQPVSIAAMPTTPVTGPLTDLQLRATAVPVAGSFFQATQPVSILAMPTTAVTGAFFQTTQPVSIATMPTTPVTGSFWQATQPVSIAAMPTTPVTGSFWQATQPVSVASMPITAVTIAATTGPVAAGTAAANSTLFGGVYNATTPTPTTGQQLAIQLDSTGSTLVNTPDAKGSGTLGALNAAVTISTAGGKGGVLIQVKNTAASLSLQVEGSLDGGATWWATETCTYPYSQSSNATINPFVYAANATNWVYFSNSSGFQMLRVRCSAYTSGSSAITMSASATAMIQGIAPNFYGVRAGAVTNVTNAPAINGDQAATYLITDKNGRLLTVPFAERGRTFAQTTAIAVITETTVVTAGGAGVFNDLSFLSFSNSSATATLVALKDATAGTTRGTWWIAAGASLSIPFTTPLSQAVANSNWSVTCSVAATSLYVNAQYVKNN